MKLGADDVIRLAREARFTLSPEEVERFRIQLSSVVQQLALLGDLEVAERSSNHDDSSGVITWRADTTGPDPLALPLEQFSPELIAGFFAVPRMMPSGESGE